MFLPLNGFVISIGCFLPSLSIWFIILSTISTIASAFTLISDSGKLYSLGGMYFSCEENILQSLQSMLYLPKRLPTYLWPPWKAAWMSDQDLFNKFRICGADDWVDTGKSPKSETQPLVCFTVEILSDHFVLGVRWRTQEEPWWFQDWNAKAFQVVAVLVEVP